MSVWSLLISATLASGGWGAGFQATTPLPDGYFGHATVASNGHLYKLGGASASQGVLGADTVLFSKVGADGQLGSWTAGTSLPVRVFFHTAAVHGGRIYLLGGFRYENGFKISERVYFADILADGSLGAWTAATALPTGTFFSSAASWNGVLYITGGWTASGETNAVYFASVAPDGSLSAWSAATPLPLGIYTHTTVQHGTLYVIGGATQQGSLLLNTVYFAPILADKTIGPWQLTASLPTPLSLHSSALWGSRIYVTGGNTGPSLSPQVYGTNILSDKTLGIWETLPPLPVPLVQHGAATSGGYLYVVGGKSGNAQQSAVYFMKVAEDFLAATVICKPRTLNLWSKGKHVTCHIEFAPEVAQASQIDGASVRMTEANGSPVPALVPIAKHTKLKQDDCDGLDDGDDEDDPPNSADDDDDEENCVDSLKVKFDRQAVQAVMTEGDNTLTLEGSLTDGRRFKGTDTIRAVQPDKKKLLTAKILGLGLDLSSVQAVGVVSSKGGKAKLTEQAGVEVPAGAVATDLVLTVERKDKHGDEEDQGRRSGEKGLKAVSPSIDFGPEGTAFSKPVTITISYDRSQLPAGTSEGSLSIYYWDPKTKDWTQLASTVDTTLQTVSAQVTHFSTYRLLSPVGASAASQLQFGEVYAFPNPASGGVNPTLHVEAGSADRLEIRIYDVSGSLVHQAEVGGPQAAFEYGWDVSGVGSGVYIYVATAHQGGRSIRTKGRVAVIK